MEISADYGVYSSNQPTKKLCPITGEKWSKAHAGRRWRKRQNLNVIQKVKKWLLLSIYFNEQQQQQKKQIVQSHQACHEDTK